MCWVFCDASQNTQRSSSRAACETCPSSTRHRIHSAHRLAQLARPARQAHVTEYTALLVSLNAYKNTQRKQKQSVGANLCDVRSWSRRHASSIRSSLCWMSLALTSLDMRIRRRPLLSNTSFSPASSTRRSLYSCQTQSHGNHVKHYINVPLSKTISLFPVNHNIGVLWSTTT